MYCDELANVLTMLFPQFGVPCYAVVPTSTIDLDTATGDDIVIEERAEEEVAAPFGGKKWTPDATRCFNPAFDVTPARFLSGIITEEGLCEPPFSTLASLKKAGAARMEASSASRLALVTKRDG